MFGGSKRVLFLRPRCPFVLFRFGWYFVNRDSSQIPDLRSVFAKPTFGLFFSHYGGLLFFGPREFGARKSVFLFLQSHQGQTTACTRSRGPAMSRHTCPACSFWFFSRALSLWLPRVMVAVVANGVSKIGADGKSKWR